MCRWDYCLAIGTTFMCKYCGTRFCCECLRGDFIGLMPTPDKCFVCNQDNCQGEMVELPPGKVAADMVTDKKKPVKKK